MEVGRVAYVTLGPNQGKLVVIVDILDAAKVFFYCLKTVLFSRNHQGHFFVGRFWLKTQLKELLDNLCHLEDSDLQFSKSRL